MIGDLQPGEVVIAEKIDRISRLPLAEAERLVKAIQSKGARLAVPGVVDLSELAASADGVTRICCGLPCRSRGTTTRPGAKDSGRASSWPAKRASTPGGVRTTLCTRE